jgi:succinate dehydrogenase hydrophobic anchor subunit
MFKYNKYFFNTKIGIIISTLSGIVGLMIFIPSTIKEYNKQNNIYFFIDFVFVLFFLFGLGLSVYRVFKLKKP